jgi:hypothetical protein
VIARAVAVGALASSVVLTTSCLTATEIAVDVTTDVPCDHVRSTTISVGELGPNGIDDGAFASTQTRCADGRIGTLVIVPSGANDSDVAFRVTTGVDKPAEECKGAGGQGCIVARRALRFLPHTRLDVPVAMRGSCEGIVCVDPATTCVVGACVPATIPDPSTCTTPGGCGETSLADAGSDATIEDASMDASAKDATMADSPADTSISDSSMDVRDAHLPDAQTPIPVTACGDITGLQAGAPWPMDRYCPSRRAKSPYVAPARLPAPIVKWSHFRQATPDFDPLIGADGTIYVPTADWHVLAFDRTGAQIGNYDAGALVSWTPAIASDGTYFAPISSLEVARLATPPSQGAFATLTPAINEIARGDLVIGSGPTLYFDDPLATLYAFNANTTQKWLKQFPSSVDFMSPAIAPTGLVYQYTKSGELYSVDTNGTATLVATLPTSTGAFVAVAPNGNILVSLVEGSALFAVKPTGTIAWSFPYADAGLAQGGAFAIGDDSMVYLSTHSAPLVAIDATGAMKWTAQSAGKACWSPILDANELVIAGCDDTMFAFDKTNGAVVWSVPLTPSVASAYAMSIGWDGVLYVVTGTSDGTTDGTIWAIGN